jgi:hypothetical protein
MSEALASLTPEHVHLARDAADRLAGSEVSLSGRRVLAALGLVAMGASKVKAAERAGVPHPNQLAPSQWRRVGLSDELVEKIRAELAALPPAVAAPPPRFMAPRDGSNRSTVRRHASPAIEPEKVVDLAADHPALVEGRTLFPTQVVGAREAVRLLVSGHNNSKLGKEVLKGDRAGWPIFQLTLEERATCPRTCAMWAGCYGNSSPFSRRHRADAELIETLRKEVAATARLYPGGFLVRLHTLGDFFSVPYVLMWAELMALHPPLHVFGYTARRTDDEDPESRKIAEAITLLAKHKWSRFAIRTSHSEPGPQRSVVFMADPKRPDVLMCPAQAKATEACATCGLCWADAPRGKTIGFLKHGMKRGGRKASRPAEELPNPAGEKIPSSQGNASGAEAATGDSPVASAPTQPAPAPRVEMEARSVRRPEPIPPPAPRALPPPSKPRVVSPGASYPAPLRLKPLTPRVLGWCRAYAARGVHPAFLAYCFDLDEQALADAVGAAA